MLERRNGPPLRLPNAVNAIITAFARSIASSSLRPSLPATLTVTASPSSPAERYIARSPKASSIFLSCGRPKEVIYELNKLDELSYPA